MKKRPRSSSRMGEQDQTNIVMVGDPGAGKKTLWKAVLDWQRERKAALVPQNAPLHYNFLEFHDETMDMKRRAGFWLLRSDQSYLSYALPSSSLDRSVVILCVDLSSPASVAPCLDRWTSAIQAHVTSFSGDGRQRLDSLKEGVAVSVRQQRGGGAGGESLPLPEGVLQHSDLLESLLPEFKGRELNLGVRLVVVGCKSSALEKKESLGEVSGPGAASLHASLRIFSLAFGASLVYTSADDGVGVSALVDQLSHMVCASELRHPPEVIHRVGIFVPLGWDTVKKIRLLTEGISSEALRRVFPFALQEQGKPTRVGGECEDKDVAGRIVGDEAFLAHLAKILEKDASALTASIAAKERTRNEARHALSKPHFDGSHGEGKDDDMTLTPKRSEDTGGARGEAESTPGSRGAGGGAGRSGATKMLKKGEQVDDELLTDYFKSLLHKPSGTSKSKLQKVKTTQGSS